MSTVTLDLPTTLKELDDDSASSLERLVPDAISLVKPTGAGAEMRDANGWAVGFFENTAGCFADERFDFPADPPIDPLQQP